MLIIMFIACIYAYIYKYKGGALWQDRYKIPIGQMSATYAWLLMYTIYTTADTYAYRHIYNNYQA